MLLIKTCHIYSLQSMCNYYYSDNQHSTKGAITFLHVTAPSAEYYMHSSYLFFIGVDLNGIRYQSGCLFS